MWGSNVALDYARRMNIPNNAFAGMKYFDDTIDSYMEAGWFKRLFINPYSVFAYLKEGSIIS